MNEYVEKSVTQMSRNEFLKHLSDVYFGRIVVKNWQLAVLNGLRAKHGITEVEVKRHG